MLREHWWFKARGAKRSFHPYSIYPRSDYMVDFLDHSISIRLQKTSFLRKTSNDKMEMSFQNLCQDLLSVNFRERWSRAYIFPQQRKLGVLAKLGTGAVCQNVIGINGKTVIKWGAANIDFALNPLIYICDIGLKSWCYDNFPNCPKFRCFRLFWQIVFQRRKLRSRKFECWSNTLLPYRMFQPKHS